MKYGLIGEKLGHSFSQEIHEQLADYQYELCPLSRAEFPSFMQQADFAAINVTIPYKEQVLPYLAEVDAQAAKIGAVNTIVNQGGCLKGYNTDFAGVCYLLRQHGIDLAGRQVLILGSGGTSKTVRAVAESQGAASVQLVSRSGGLDSAGQPMLDYQQAAAVKTTQVIINTTPRGMYPHNQEQPLFKLADFPELEAVADVIYNPLYSNLVLQARELGLKACGGLEMLVAQAKYAAELFIGDKIADDKIEEIYRKLRKKKLNLALIGMPGSGKTTVGRRLAELLQRPFVDCDAKIVQRQGCSIADIFSSQGEAAFRQIETATLADIAKEGGQVIATGGGVVTQAVNMQLLRQNSLLIWLDRPLDKLAISAARPLSPNARANEQLYQQRAPLYQRYADLRLPNEQSAAAAAEKIAAYFAAETGGEAKC